ncbi:MAG: DegT/DnrJ/EryC1/StrS family aminotransferase [bacterium]|nr:DegT/DnrJ/EryC1/StrS family aminotransferase [bacterium]
MIKPAVLGGRPMFEEEMHITRPTLPRLDIDLFKHLDRMFSMGAITNGQYVRELEEKVADYLGVRHAIAVSCCTSGLMLVIKALGLFGEVILPSFTFSATAHALMWNSITPVFVDCDPEGYNLNPDLIEASITDRTSGIMAVYTFGNPPRIKALEEIAARNNLKLIFDAAHGFGSEYQAKRPGSFGHAEVFSMSPTKLLVAGEGGIVTTNDDELARKIQIGRNYGNPGDYDCEFAGLNARMEEFNAYLALASLPNLEGFVQRRNDLVASYKKELADMPGLSFQRIDPADRNSYKDFSILIEPLTFGLNRNQLAQALKAEKIDTKKYFYPPVHRQKAYAFLYAGYEESLPVTGYVTENILCLPLYSHMEEKEVLKICSAIKRIYDFREDIARIGDENA